MTGALDRASRFAVALGRRAIRWGIAALALWGAHTLAGVVGVVALLALMLALALLLGHARIVGEWEQRARRAEQERDGYRERLADVSRALDDVGVHPLGSPALAQRIRVLYSYFVQQSLELGLSVSDIVRAQEALDRAGIPREAGYIPGLGLGELDLTVRVLRLVAHRDAVETELRTLRREYAAEMRRSGRRAEPPAVDVEQLGEVGDGRGGKVPVFGPADGGKG